MSKYYLFSVFLKNHKKKRLKCKLKIISSPLRHFSFAFGVHLFLGMRWPVYRVRTVKMHFWGYFSCIHLFYLKSKFV